MVSPRHWTVSFSLLLYSHIHSVNTAHSLNTVKQDKSHNDVSQDNVQQQQQLNVAAVHVFSPIIHTLLFEYSFLSTHSLNTVS